MLRLASIALLIVACKGSNNSPAAGAQGQDRTTTVETANGDKVTLEEKKDGTTSLRSSDDASLTGTRGKLPDGFPLPVYAGATIGDAMKLNDKQYAATLHTDAAPKLVTDYYAGVLVKRGFTIQRNEATGDREESTVVGVKADEQVVVTAGHDKGATSTEVSLAYGKP